MEEERNYTVYMHVCKENGKTYIGITSKSVEERWGSNGRGYKTQMFYNAIKKYGWENFEHIILFENKTQNEAEELEKLYIRVLISNNRSYGYNIENGGNSIGKVSDETRQKLREAHIGLQAGSKNPRAKKIYCDGKVFDTIKDCADNYNINISTIILWLNGTNGMPKEFFNKNLHYMGEENNEAKPQLDLTKGNSPHAKRVICDNVIYECLGDCADKYNINICTMSNWLIGDNRMPKDFIDMNLRYLDDNTTIYQVQDNSNKGKQVICDGIVFKSVKLCAEYYNIKRETMNSWLLGKRKMPREFKNLELNYYYEEEMPKEKIKRGKKVICDNIIFNSISECSKYYNVNRRMMNYWLLKSQHMPQEYKGLGLDYYIEN